MTPSRYHAEWLNLVENAGPFVSLPVLLKAFPHGLDELRESAPRRAVREQYETWCERGRNHVGAHQAWIRYVLTEFLAYPDALLAEGQSMPPGMEAVLPRFHETLRPNFALKHRDAGNKPVLLISFYPSGTRLESPLPDRNWKASPATRMMELLHATGITTGLVTNGEQWMLVFARCGEATGFASWYADLWMQEPVTLQAFYSLLCLRRFFGVADAETLPALLLASSQDQQEVTDQLGHQVRQAVEVLVQAIDRLDADSGRKLLAGVDEPTLYSASLTIMMRLVFVFAAEERGMLLLGQNAFYEENYALSPLRNLLREHADQHGEEVLEHRCDAWFRLLANFRALHDGVEHETMRLPAYGGALFDPDRYPFLEGRAAGSAWTHTPAQPLQINNRVVLHLLEALQLLRVKLPGCGPAETRRLSFRALDIEQIGHVYEGLLDHTVKRAGEVVLGLTGSKDKEPEIPLTKLEELARRAPVQTPADEPPDLLLAAEREQGVPMTEGGAVRYFVPDSELIEFLKEETGRNPKTLAKALNAGYAVDEPRLYRACGHDLQLFNRVRPFAGLIREDSFSQLMVIPVGCAYVTSGSDRRSSGTHYTPRSLTEPIVQYTLEPLVYVGPADGKPESEWVLKSPKELLDLRICDLAMGSGAFLVQTCRYLSERLCESWDAIEETRPDAFLITPEGELATGVLSERLLPADSEERLAIARRIVADRCLYGVDINPMAVEMAKLSMWLITLQKDRPFSFLDHAFKCGDSLLGVTSVKEIENFSLRFKEGDIVEHAFSTMNLFRYVEDASNKRRALEVLPSNDSIQIEAKRRLYAEAEDSTAKVKALADCLIALELRSIGDKQYVDQRIAAADQAEFAMRKPIAEFHAYARGQLSGRRPFHWAVEFPEIFDHGGFDAFVGNPPFMGGQKITGAFGSDYRDYIVRVIAGQRKGSADFSVFFMLRATYLNRLAGTLGLVITSAIAEGDNREVGLEHLDSIGRSIFRAETSQPWPGTASVTYSAIYLTNQRWNGPFALNGKEEDGITPYLTASGDVCGRPYRLKANEGKSFIGHYVLGMGFLLQPADAKALVEKDGKNRDVLFPFLNGAELNATWNSAPTRWVINFRQWPLSNESKPQGYLGPVAEDYADCLNIVRQLVKPERDANKRDRRRERWWLFGDYAPSLEQAIQQDKLLFAISMTAAKHIAFCKVERGVLLSHALAVLAFNRWSEFGVVSCSLHDVWTRMHTSYNLALPRYIHTDCFLTFPFPKLSAPLDKLSKEYHDCRQDIMRLKQQGSTDTYNRFHDLKEMSEDIMHFRAIHVEMDQAVSAAYGWSDLGLGHGFHETKQGIRYTISESARRIVLDRLLALNHERYAEEVKAGLHDKKKPAAGVKRAKKETQSDKVKESGTPYLTQELPL